MELQTATVPRSMHPMPNSRPVLTSRACVLVHNPATSRAAASRVLQTGSQPSNAHSLNLTWDLNLASSKGSLRTVWGFWLKVRSKMVSCSARPGGSGGGGGGGDGGDGGRGGGDGGGDGGRGSGGRRAGLGGGRFLRLARLGEGGRGLGGGGAGGGGRFLRKRRGRLEGEGGGGRLVGGGGGGLFLRKRRGGGGRCTKGGGGRLEPGGGGRLEPGGGGRLVPGGGGFLLLGVGFSMMAGTGGLLPGGGGAPFKMMWAWVSSSGDVLGVVPTPGSSRLAPSSCANLLRCCSTISAAVSIAAWKGPRSSSLLSPIALTRGSVASKRATRTNTRDGPLRFLCTILFMHSWHQPVLSMRLCAAASRPT